MAAHALVCYRLMNENARSLERTLENNLQVRAPTEKVVEYKWKRFMDDCY